MKKAKSYLLLVFFIATTFILPKNALAFTEAPVAVIVFDANGRIDGELSNVLSQRMKRRFRFPDYKVMEFSEVNSRLKNISIPNTNTKRPFFRQEQLQALAGKIPAEIICVVWIDSIRDEIIYGSIFGLAGEKMRFSRLKMDITIYKKTTDTYLPNKVNYSKTEPYAVSSPTINIAIEKFSDTIDEFKEHIK